MVAMRADDPIARAVVASIRTGDLDTLRRLLATTSGLASAGISSRRGHLRTPLHIAADWPGYFPHAPESVRLLLSAGADVNAPIAGNPSHAETPLHWAASSDDLEVAVALVEGDADIEASGGSLSGGPALDNAVGYGCWHVARLLVAHGAQVGLWQAAGLGLTARVAELMEADPPPSPDQVTEAFWQACHGGQRRTADYLLSRGADLDKAPSYAKETPLDIAGSLDTSREATVSWLRELGARSSRPRAGDGAVTG